MSTRQKLIFMNFIVLFLLMFGSVFAWKETEISKSVPLPKKIQIIQPTGDLPKEIAAFSGRWEGVWEGGAWEVKAVLVVEEIFGDSARVIYGWSRYASITADYEVYKKVKIVPGPKPKIKFSNRFIDFSFEMGADLKIHGIGKPKGGLNVATITMNKIEED